jgi:phosphatidylinositol glycan class M
MIISWFIAQGLWLLPAYLLEFRGMDTYVYVWLAGCLFFVVNVWIVTRMIAKHKKAPLKITQKKRKKKIN